MLPYLLMLLFSISIIAIDQLSKIWVMLEIPIHSSVKAIPGVFHLTYANQVPHLNLR
jgi:lipoprotein signal peptidase